MHSASETDQMMAEAPIAPARSGPDSRHATARTLMLALGLGLIWSAQANSQGVIDSEVSAIPDVSADTSVGFGNGSMVVAPIPFSNPTIGSGLMLGAGYLFTASEGSKPSVVGIGGLKSNNGSEAIGLSINLAFDNNRWLFESLIAKASAFYDLYTPIGVLPIRQEGVLTRMSLAYGVTSELSFGAAFRYLNTTITPDVPGLPAIPSPFDEFLDAEIASIGLITDWDRRDNTIYATTGDNLQFEAIYNVALRGLVRDYTKAFLTYTRYQELNPTGVLVARVSTCAASSTTPFFDLCGLGTTDAFRGFSATQFIDQRSASVQVEYRQRLGKRLGVVGFAGARQVGPSYSDLGTGGTHGAAGLGLRYRVSKKFPLDFSVDASRNSLGEDLLYIYVGQRF